MLFAKCKRLEFTFLRVCLGKHALPPLLPDLRRKLCPPSCRRSIYRRLYSRTGRRSLPLLVGCATWRKKQRHADLAVRSCVRGNCDRSASTSPIIRDPLCGNVIPRRKISRGDIGNDACRRKYNITSIRSNNVREFNIRHIARHGSCPIQRPTMPRIVIAKYYRHRQTYWVFWGQIPIAQPSLYLENIV